MARIRRRRLFWTPATAADVVGYEVYAAPATQDVDAFKADIEAGRGPKIGETAVPEFYVTDGIIAEGNWHFAVCTKDDDGNFSSPFVDDQWVNVPLDVTAPDAPTEGGIDSGE